MRAVLFTLIFVGVSALNLTATAQVDETVALSLFTQRVHPFLVKNCSECHGEQTYGFEGPRHSVSAPADAFATFKRFVNWDSPEQSRIYRQAHNKHYCTDYFSCENAEMKSKEAMQMIVEYIGAVREASAGRAKSDPVSPSNMSESEEFARIYSELKPYRSGEITSRSAMQDFYAYTVPLEIPRLTGSELLLAVLVRTISPEFSVIEELRLIGKGIFALQGLRFVVNGQTITKATGAETLDRAVFLEGSPYGSSSVPLLLGKPTLPIKVGDSLAVTFDHLEELDKYPSRLCKHDRVRGLVSMQLIQAPELIFATETWAREMKLQGGIRQLDELERCLVAESRVDLSSPRLSPLLRDVKEQDRKKALDYIYLWIEKMTEHAAMPP
ncbi:MAG: hypothetical protein AB7G93_01070 [Bdellovibrionales bacterium]